MPPGNRSAPHVQTEKVRASQVFALASKGPSESHPRRRASARVSTRIELQQTEGVRDVRSNPAGHRASHDQLKMAGAQDRSSPFPPRNSRQPSCAQVVRRLTTNARERLQLTRWFLVGQRLAEFCQSPPMASWHSESSAKIEGKDLRTPG